MKHYTAHVAPVLLSPDPTTDIGRSAGNAPAGKPKDAPKVKANRFDAHFPVDSVIFKSNVQTPGKPWNDGTISQSLADAVIHIGTTGAVIASARIVMKTKGDAKTFDLQMPSSGGSFKRPMIEAGDEDGAKEDYTLWRRKVVERWITQRKAAVASGVATPLTGGALQGVTAGTDDLAALGLG